MKLPLKLMLTVTATTVATKTMIYGLPEKFIVGGLAAWVILTVSVIISITSCEPDPNPNKKREDNW